LKSKATKQTGDCRVAQVISGKTEKAAAYNWDPIRGAISQTRLFRREMVFNEVTTPSDACMQSSVQLPGRSVIGSSLVELDQPNHGVCIVLGMLIHVATATDSRPPPERFYRLYAATSLSMRRAWRHSGHSGCNDQQSLHTSGRELLSHIPSPTPLDIPSRRHDHTPSPPLYLRFPRPCPAARGRACIVSRAARARRA
jgi:hypothetical protein